MYKFLYLLGSYGFPSWWTNLNRGEKISVKVYKHRNLVRNKSVVDNIIGEIIM